MVAERSVENISW